MRRARRDLSMISLLKAHIEVCTWSKGSLRVGKQLRPTTPIRTCEAASIFFIADTCFCCLERTFWKTIMYFGLFFFSKSSTSAWLWDRIHTCWLTIVLLYISRSYSTEQTVRSFGLVNICARRQSFISSYRLLQSVRCDIRVFFKVVKTYYHICLAIIHTCIKVWH